MNDAVINFLFLNVGLSGLTGVMIYYRARALIGQLIKQDEEVEELFHAHHGNPLTILMNLTKEQLNKNQQLRGFKNGFLIAVAYGWLSGLILAVGLALN